MRAKQRQSEVTYVEIDGLSGTIAAAHDQLVMINWRDGRWGRESDQRRGLL